MIAEVLAFPKPCGCEGRLIPYTFISGFGVQLSGVYYQKTFEKYGFTDFQTLAKSRRMISEISREAALSMMFQYQSKFHPKK